MTGTGRYPPQPKFPPFSFYSCFRLGDPEQLKTIMETDPYYWTQDNGAGAPIHFATTYKQLDMVHHIVRECPETINQRDGKGFTALHRAAFLCQYDGYLEIYEYLLSEGADPTIKTDDYDPYLNPGKKMPIEIAIEDEEVRGKIKALEEKYASTAKRPEPHADIGDWWAIYDYGLDTVKTWAKDYKPEYPEDKKREEEDKEKMEYKAERHAQRLKAEAEGGAQLDTHPLNTAKDTPIAFLFPGQGSQAVGMLAKFKDMPKVKEMCDKAAAVLGYDLLDVCLNGPKEKLDNTVYSQPALFVGGLAALEKLREDNPDAVANCSATAGLSLGEYTALVFAGALSFEDGLKIVKVRAESMEAASKVGDHGMLSVVGLADDVLEKIVQDAKTAVGGDCVAQIANYLFPQGRVVSGDKTVLTEVQKMATDKGALKVQFVFVSGAFHTARMQSAREALEAVLKEVTFTAPTVPVYSNVTGKIVEDHTKLPVLLAEQLVSPVKWEDTMKDLISTGKDQLFELGPKSQIKSMTKRINQEVWKGFTNVDVCA